MSSKVKWLISIGVFWFACLALISWDLYQVKTSLRYIHQLRNQVFDFRQDYFEHKPYRTHDLNDVATRVESIHHLSQALSQQNTALSFHPDLSQFLYTLDRFFDQSQQYLGVEFDVIALIHQLQALREKYATNPERQSDYFKISTYVFEIVYDEKRYNPHIFLAFDRLFQRSLDFKSEEQHDLQIALASASRVLNGYAQGYYLVNQLVRHPFYDQIIIVEDRYEQQLTFYVWFTLFMSALFLLYVLSVWSRVIRREWSRRENTTPNEKQSPPQTKVVDTVESVVHFDELEEVLANDTDAMEMILNVFLQDHKDDEQRLRQAIDQHQQEEAVRLAHSLKGIGGGLSAPLLIDAARDLELALANQSADVEKKLARLTGVLLRAFEEVSQYLESEKPVS